jgi:hypothetical protein
LPQGPRWRKRAAGPGRAQNEQKSAAPGGFGLIRFPVSPNTAGKASSGAKHARIPSFCRARLRGIDSLRPRLAALRPERR